MDFSTLINLSDWDNILNQIIENGRKVISIPKEIGKDIMPSVNVVAPNKAYINWVINDNSRIGYMEHYSFRPEINGEKSNFIIELTGETKGRFGYINVVLEDNVDMSSIDGSDEDDSSYEDYEGEDESLSSRE